MATSEGSPLVASLERLAGDASRPTENLENIKIIISRIHFRMKVQDDKKRLETLAQLVNSDHHFLEHLVRITELCHDAHMVNSICMLLHDCLSPSNKGDTRNMLMHNLISLNMAEVIFRSLKVISADSLAAIEPCILSAFQVLAKLASKDSKLAVKARLVGGVKLTHQLIQAHARNNVTILPLLMVIKYLAVNGTNQIVLGKDGCVGTMASILGAVPKTHWAKLRFLMEILALLTKAKSNVIRLLKESGLQKILSTLEVWEKVDKHHQLKLLKGIFGTLCHLCDSKHGRKAVVSLGGVDILQKFIMACPADMKYDIPLSSAINVFLKCVSKGELPVSSVKGAIKFTIPAEDGFPESCKEKAMESTPPFDGNSSDENEDEEEEDLDDDMSHDIKGLDITSGYQTIYTHKEELLKFNQFFPELNDFEVLPATRFKKATGSASERGSITDQICGINSDCYLQASAYTKSLIQFVKVAYPDLIGATSPPFLEPLYEKNRKVCRNKALATVDRVLRAENYDEKVVYDLDYLLESDHSKHLISQMGSSPSASRSLSNWDEKRIGKRDITGDHLSFESRFESGNLRRAIQVSSHEYDLILNADVNSLHHHQWFYFEVSNMEANIPYVFNIINNEKPNSEFNFGMKPVLFSVCEALQGKHYWVRTGTDICYHKNHYSRVPKNSDNCRFRKMASKCYYTATFTVTFLHAYDVCYLAYHYPYTYTKLQTFLVKMESMALPPSIFFSNQVLCYSLNGNAVPLLTITNKNAKRGKEVIFLTGRVHPGESNSSWVMNGVIEFLLGSCERAQVLRDRYVFKVVPMLNPEGVIHGNQRCGLTDEDLNRRWRFPSPVLHPAIYNTKALLEYLRTVVQCKIRVFCDFHGHSRQKNVFMYGCSHHQSWWPGDKDCRDSPDVMTLPHLARSCMRTFSMSDCHFHIERSREATARVAVWRQFKVVMSFTMEASTCGCDQGPYKDYHLGPRQLLESGEGFCIALSYLHEPEALSPQYKTVPNSRATCDENFDLNADHSLVPMEWISSGDEELDSESDLDINLYGYS